MTGFPTTMSFAILGVITAVFTFLTLREGFLRQKGG
jgi:hypothetical protein